MSSWVTSPWSNFCDPHWELICCNNWYTGTSEISTPSKVPPGTHFHVRHGTKTTIGFLSAFGEASWSLLPCLDSLLSGSTVQPENIPVSSRWQVRSETAKKKISTNINHSYCQGHWVSLNLIFQMTQKILAIFKWEVIFLWSEIFFSPYHPIVCDTEVKSRIYLLSDTLS